MPRYTPLGLGESSLVPPRVDGKIIKKLGISIFYQLIGKDPNRIVKDLIGQMVDEPLNLSAKHALSSKKSLDFEKSKKVMEF